MNDRQGLPAYIHTDEGRAYLTLNLDVYGKWSAGYLQWYEADDDGLQPAKVIGETINGGESVEDVLKKLAEKMKVK